MTSTLLSESPCSAYLFRLWRIFAYLVTTKWWCPVDLLARPAPPLSQHRIKWTWTVLFIRKMSYSENHKESSGFNGSKRKNCPTKRHWLIWHLQTESFNIKKQAPKQFHFANCVFTEGSLQLRFVIRDQKSMRSLLFWLDSRLKPTWNQMPSHDWDSTLASHGPCDFCHNWYTNLGNGHWWKKSCTTWQEKQSWTWWISLISTLEILWCHLQRYLRFLHFQLGSRFHPKVYIKSRNDILTV